MSISSVFAQILHYILCHARRRGPAVEVGGVADDCQGEQHLSARAVTEAKTGMKKMVSSLKLVVSMKLTMVTNLCKVFLFENFLRGSIRWRFSRDDHVDVKTLAH